MSCTKWRSGVNVLTPWHLWGWLAEIPRVEIVYYSIHYIDLIRSFLGDPAGVYAKTNKHPSAQTEHGLQRVDAGLRPSVIR